MSNEEEAKNFKYEDFAGDLSSQASQVVPQDIDAEDSQLMIDIIYRFCKMAGEALAKEENSKLTTQDAALVTQFIGEWIFHKSVDLIRGGVEAKLREGILQKIAFTIFDIAKKAIERKFSQEQIIELVETHVKKCFEKSLLDLQEKGILTKEDLNNALSQSNIDTMTKEQVLDEFEEEVRSMSDEKIMKLASLAVLIQGFDNDKIKNILKSFDKPERDVILKYLKMENLSEQIETKSVLRCFDEIKNTLPEGVVVSYEKAYKKMYKIVKNSQKNQILNIIDKERPKVKNFVLSCYNGKRENIPAHIANVISKYVEEKIS